MSEWLTPGYQQKYALENILPDKSWQKLGFPEYDFSKDGLDTAVSLTRAMALKNPLIKRAVEIDVFYVWGQGISFKAHDGKVDEVLHKFWNNPQNRRELTSIQALELKEKRLEVEGNIFFTLFSDIIGDVYVRSIPFEQIKRVVKSPEDDICPLYYHRVWQKKNFSLKTAQETTKEEKRWYVDYLAEYPDADWIGDDPVDEDARVYHVKVGGFDNMSFGVPGVLSALDWALAVKAFLEDWATIVRIYRTFAFQIQGNTPASISEGKQSLQSGYSLTTPENNPLPGVGSTILMPGQRKIEPIQTAKATVSAEDGRQLKLMTAAGTGFPEPMFGDASTGNLATQKALDRPTELKIILRRELWKSIFTEIFNYVIDKKVAMSILPEDVDRTVDISFPDILEHDIKEVVQGLVAGFTLNGFEPRTDIVPKRQMAQALFTALKMPNAEKVLASLSDTPEKSEGNTTPPRKNQPQDVNAKNRNKQ